MLRRSHIRRSFRGYTLIEVVASLFVFSIMMAAVSQIFATAFSGYRSSKIVGRDVENAQYVINISSKELRTSSVVSPTGSLVSSSFVQFFDHSQDKCFRYRINGTSLEVAQADVADVATCSGTSLASFSPVAGGVSAGAFYVTSSSAAGPKRVGKVTISLDIATGIHHAFLQTTVSLRDFGTVWP